MLPAFRIERLEPSDPYGPVWKTGKDFELATQCFDLAPQGA